MTASPPDWPVAATLPPFAGFQEIESGAYYGTGYQDVQHRKPSIRNALRYLDWVPRLSLEHSVETTLDFFLRDYVESQSKIDEVVCEKAAAADACAVPRVPDMIPKRVADHADRTADRR